MVVGSRLEGATTVEGERQGGTGEQGMEASRKRETGKKRGSEAEDEGSGG